MPVATDPDPTDTLTNVVTYGVGGGNALPPFVVVLYNEILELTPSTAGVKYDFFLQATDNNSLASPEGVQSCSLQFSITFVELNDCPEFVNNFNGQVIGAGLSSDYGFNFAVTDLDETPSYDRLAVTVNCLLCADSFYELAGSMLSFTTSAQP